MTRMRQLSKKRIHDLADKIVNKSLRIGQKPNLNYEKIKKRYPWMHGRFSLETARRRSRISVKKLEKLLKKYTDVDYGPLLIKQGNTYHVKDKVGHSVLITYNPSNKALALEVQKLCWKNGAHTLMEEIDAGIITEKFLVSPIDTLHEFSSLSKAIYENVDFTINIWAVEKEFWQKSIPIPKLKASAPAGQRRRKIMNKRKIRWLLLGWPHPSLAKELKIPYKKFHRIMFKAIDCSYEKKTIEVINKYYHAFRGSKNIHIFADDGTNLKFSVKGRHFLRDDYIIDERDVKIGDVGLNIPCGEVFVAPVENSANGTIVFPKTAVIGHGMIHGLKLFFKRGKVVKYTAKKGKKHLDDFLAKNIGDKTTIAELGIGCNREAKNTNGFILIDEKIFKTIHLAIGDNLSFGGRNSASSHLDFIKPMEPCNGKVYADGKLVIDKGILVD